MQGLMVLNSSGFTQIDQEFTNHVLIARGTVVCPAAYLQNGNHVVSATVIPFPAVSEMPMVFVRTPYGGRVVFGTSGPVAYSEPSISSVKCFCPDTASAVTIEYLVYSADTSIIAPEGTHGIIVNKSNGLKCFDSRLTYPNIVMSGTYVMSTTNPAYGTNIVFNVPGNGNLYFLLNATGYLLNSFGGGSNARYYNSQQTVNNSTYEISWTRLTGSFPGSVDRTGNLCKVMAIRVDY